MWPCPRGEVWVPGWVGAASLSREPEPGSAQPADRVSAPGTRGPGMLSVVPCATLGAQRQVGGLRAPLCPDAEPGTGRAEPMAHAPALGLRTRGGRQGHRDTGVAPEGPDL